MSAARAGLPFGCLQAEVLRYRAFWGLKETCFSWLFLPGAQTEPLRRIMCSLQHLVPLIGGNPGSWRSKARRALGRGLSSHRHCKWADQICQYLGLPFRFASLSFHGMPRRWPEMCQVLGLRPLRRLRRLPAREGRLLGSFFPWGEGEGRRPPGVFFQGLCLLGTPEPKEPRPPFWPRLPRWPWPWHLPSRASPALARQVTGSCFSGGSRRAFVLGDEVLLDAGSTRLRRFAKTP